jgi:hypothetical protein
MASDKRVVRIGPEAHRVVEAVARDKALSLSEATDWLVMYAHNRMEALRKDREKRLAAEA